MTTARSIQDQERKNTLRKAEENGQKITSVAENLLPLGSFSDSHFFNDVTP